MGCCASCFYYTESNDDYEYEQIRRETARQRIVELYKEQYAREEAEGIIVLPMQTRMSYIDLEKVRAVFPPINVRLS